MIHYIQYSPSAQAFSKGQFQGSPCLETSQVYECLKQNEKLKVNVSLKVHKTLNCMVKIINMPVHIK